MPNWRLFFIGVAKFREKKTSAKALVFNLTTQHRLNFHFSLDLSLDL
jgi:hypothetical protein